jgi:hypothetical protein
MMIAANEIAVRAVGSQTLDSVVRLRKGALSRVNFTMPTGYVPARYLNLANGWVNRSVGSTGSCILNGCQ